jgi:hypothetical protein
MTKLDRPIFLPDGKNDSRRNRARTEWGQGIARSHGYGVFTTRPPIGAVPKRERHHGGRAPGQYNGFGKVGHRKLASPRRLPIPQIAR